MMCGVSPLHANLTLKVENHSNRKINAGFKYNFRYTNGYAMTGSQEMPIYDIAPGEVREVQFPEKNFGDLGNNPGRSEIRIYDPANNGRRLMSKDISDLRKKTEEAVNGGQPLPYPRRFIDVPQRFKIDVYGIYAAPTPELRLWINDKIEASEY